MARSECRRPQPCPERRRALGLARQGLVWLGVMALLTPLVRFISFTLPRRPRHITVSNKLNPGGFHVAEDFILFAGTRGRPWAVSRTCTHLGCQVTFRQNLNMLVCPCHHSRFSLQGRRLAGPASRDLAKYPVRVLGNEDSVDGYVVTL